MKTGGWVYKSWRDWSAECALSVAQIKRVHRAKLLEQFGIHRKLMKANGCPTVHYRLDLKTFLYRVAEFLRIAIDELQKYFTYITFDTSRQAELENVEVENPPEETPLSHEKPEDNSPLIGTLTAKDMWQMAKSQWEYQFDRGTYLTCFHKANYRNFCPDSHVWTIHVPNDIVRQMLQTRLYRNVRHTLSSMIGFECEVIFEVEPPRR